MTVTGEEEDDRCGKPYRRRTITKKTKKTTKDTVNMKEFGDGMKEKKVLRRREDGKNEGENEEEDGVDMNDDDFRGLGRGEIDDCAILPTKSSFAFVNPNNGPTDIDRRTVEL